MSPETRVLDAEKQQQLKSIIRKLHDGVPVKKLRKEFAGLIKNTSAAEIAEMETALIEEGFPVEEVQRLCDVHAQIFEKSLKSAGKSSRIPGHPIHTYIMENRAAKKILKQIRRTAKKLKKGSPGRTDMNTFAEQLQQLRQIEKHFQRKENQLFPMLEAKAFTGPTTVMWGKHDEIRNMLKEADAALGDKRWDDLANAVTSASSAIKKLIFLEEKILYPTAEKKLSVIEWAKMKKGEPEIGYAWVTPAGVWDAQLAAAVAPEPVSESRENYMKNETAGTVPLSQGALSAEQIDLLLKNLPVDITFVDEHNRVRYYSDTSERIFPRSPGIIGREVKNCHPPKSVHIVEDIIKNFREKKKKVAEFWIRMDGKFIHIRYFPLYDESGTYRGVIEVSQEISNIQKLEGERRLLDW